MSFPGSLCRGRWPKAGHPLPLATGPGARCLGTGASGSTDVLPSLCPGQECPVRATHGDGGLSVLPASSAVVRSVCGPSSFPWAQCLPRPRTVAPPRGLCGDPSAGATPKALPPFSPPLPGPRPAPGAHDGDGRARCIQMVNSSPSAAKLVNAISRFLRQNWALR